MPKEELLDAVWGDRWVSESALTTRIKEIRRATGDGGDVQAVVRTVRGRGYQLVARVRVGEEAQGDAVRAAEGLLLGRDRDCEELVARVRPGSLVTLVGPGGVGKTALARVVVTMVAGAFADGVVRVDLTAIDDPGNLLAALASAAQVGDADERGLLEVLSRLEAVVLLDDADDMVTQVGRLCGSLLGPGSRLALVVTSRERLGVAGEQLWPVLPLPVEASRELISRRAHDLAPLGSLRAAGPASLDALAAAVDRLPLAIEMLAGLSAVLDVSEMRELVGRRPDLVTSVHRDAPERHRSVARLVERSVDRLDPAALHAMVVLGSFAGSFSASDAAALVGDGYGDGQGEGLSLVRDLVDRSLVSPVREADRPQFQLLRTVKQVILASADPVDLAAAGRRHADFVLARLQDADHRLRGVQEEEGAAVFNRLADEARAAHTWARRCEPSWAIRLSWAVHLYAYSRLWSEPGRWAAAITGPQLVPELSPELAVVIGSQAAQEGRLSEAASILEPVSEHEDDRVRAAALETLSDVEIYLGLLDRAERHAERLTRLGHDLEDARMVGIGSTNLALAQVYSDRPETALRTLDLADPAQMAPSERAWLAFARGEALVELEDGSAGQRFAEAVRLGRSVGNRFVAGVALEQQARHERRRGDLAAAADLYVALVSTYLRHGNLTHLTHFLRDAVPLLADLDEPRAAAQVAGWVLDQGPRAGYGPVLEVVRTTLGTLTERHGHQLVDQWAHAGRAMSTAQTCEHAVETLQNHARPEPGTDPHAILS